LLFLGIAGSISPPVEVSTMLGKIDVGVLLTLSLSLGVVSTILGKGVEEGITS